MGRGRSGRDVQKVDELKISWEENKKEGGWGTRERVKEKTRGGREKKEDAQTNASLGNRCNQLSQSAND